MKVEANCPFCVLPLELGDEEATCANKHVFKVEGLSLATNLLAARALWLAVTAMEDDAAGLAWRAQRTPAGRTAEALLAQAQGARDAATTLRVLAVAAQQRLDALPIEAAS